MNSTIKASRYFLNDYKKGMLIYYSIIVAVSLLMLYAYSQVGAGISGKMEFSGFGFSAMIFMFVSGLNSFKIYFKFMMANNITRKRYYWAIVMTFTLASAVMASIDAALNRLLMLVIPYKGLVQQIYNRQLLIEDLLWTFTFFIMAASLGWFFNMLYYRSNNIMKTVICLAPVTIFIILAVISKMTEGALAVAIFNFLAAALGLNTMNPLVASVSFTITAVAALVLSSLLVRRITLKE